MAVLRRIRGKIPDTKPVRPPTYNIQWLFPTTSTLSVCKISYPVLLTLYIVVHSVCIGYLILYILYYPLYIILLTLYICRIEDITHPVYM